MNALAALVAMYRAGAFRVVDRSDSWRVRWHVGMALRHGTAADVARALGRQA